MPLQESNLGDMASCLVGHRCQHGARPSGSKQVCRVFVFAELFMNLNQKLCMSSEERYRLRLIQQRDWRRDVRLHSHEKSNSATVNNSKTAFASFTEFIPSLILCSIIGSHTSSPAGQKRVNISLASFSFIPSWVESWIC